MRRRRRSRGKGFVRDASRTCHWQRNYEGGAVAGLGNIFHTTAMHFSEGSNDGKTKPEPLSTKFEMSGAMPRNVESGEERVKKMRDERRIDSRSFVFDADFAGAVVKS